nr:hypothetical protein [Mucilaginibacter sp. E4BP6]
MDALTFKKPYLFCHFIQYIIINSPTASIDAIEIALEWESWFWAKARLELQS